jgi:hypothetical protein
VFPFRFYFIIRIFESSSLPLHLSSSQFHSVEERFITDWLIIQTRAQATKYYNAKADYIRSNLEALQETIQRKQENMNLLIGVLEGKLTEEAGSSAKG